jgi:hypothetical protein
VGDGDQRARLEAAVVADAGATEFPALAELYRREGRLADAERVVRRGLERSQGNHAGHVVLALVLLEQGRDLDARAVLEPLAAGTLERIGAMLGASSPASIDGLSDAEFEDAFDRAETDRDELIDPDRVAAEAVERADTWAEGLVETGRSAGFAPGATFATHTMANLLERQGDIDGAERIRASLRERTPPVETGTGTRRTQIVAELERWLGNIQNLPGVRT